MAKHLMLIALNAERKQKYLRISGERTTVNVFRNWLANEEDMRQGLPVMKDLKIRPKMAALQDKKT